MVFPIRFSGVNQAMAVLGILPSRSRVEIDDREIRVSLGWVFRMVAPLESVRAVSLDHGRVLSWGAHGWRGQWLVNGSSRGLVRIELEPAARAHVWPLRVAVRVLRVSVEDPDGLVAALA